MSTLEKIKFMYVQPVINVFSVVEVPHKQKKGLYLRQTWSKKGLLHVANS